MSLKSLSFLTVMAVLCLSVAAIAQDQPPAPPKEQPTQPDQEQVFRLQRDSATAASELEFDDEMQAWKPRIDQGTIEVSFALGFLNLNTTLLQADQIIYNYTQEYTYFGDVEISGQSAFNPVLRMGFNWSRWFALEGIGGLSFSDYTSTIENRKRQKNEPNAPIEEDPPLGEYDAEERSLLTGQAGVNAVIYPFNISERVITRFHPYVTLGFEYMWYSMNSNYTGETAGSWGGNLGAGIRLLADENVSVRFEVLYHRNDLQWTPAEYFTELNEGTLQIPLEEWPEGGSRQPVTEYDSNPMNLLNWSIGVQGSF